MVADSAFVNPGSIARLRGIIEGLNASRIWLLTGESSFERCGAAQRLNDILSGLTCHHVRQSPLVVRLEDLENMTSELRKFSPDLILAVGGGAVIDSAKALSVLGTGQCVASKLLEADLTTVSNVPVVAVPTTAGTGSEATAFSAVYLAGRKYSLASAKLMPYAALVDAELTRSLPPYETACSGLDALAQSIESFWSRRSTEQSRQLSREALQLSFGSLIPAVKNGEFGARIDMARAAHLAGKAINLAGTTAPHAFSYGFTYDYRIPHGHAVALTLPEFFDYNCRRTEGESSDVPDGHVERIEELCALLRCSTVAQASDQLRWIIDECGLVNDLAGLKMTAGDLKAIAEKVDPVRLANNPRTVPPEMFFEILQHACRG